MKRVILVASALAISLPLYAFEVPVSEADELPPEILKLAQAEAKHQEQEKPLKAIPAKQANPKHEEAAEVAAKPVEVKPIEVKPAAPEESSNHQQTVSHDSPPVDSAPLFQDDTINQRMVQSVTPPMKDMLQEMQSLQNEIKQLRGQIEMQKHEMTQFNYQQSTQIKQLENKLSTKSAKTKENEDEKPDPDNVGVNDEPTPDQESAKEDQVLKAYQEAFVLIREKKYAEAAVAMESYLKVYPDSQYAPNAYYWLGELYMAQGFTDKGMQQFSLVVKNYPASSKAAAATLKLGYSLYEQSQWRRAREQFNTVIHNFPNTSEATLAKSRIKELDQQGL